MTSLVEDTVVTHTDKASLLELRDLTVDYGYGPRKVTHGDGELAPAAGTLALLGIGLIPVLGAVGDEGSSPAADTGPLRAAFGVIDQDPEGAAVAVAAHRLDDLVDLVALGLEVTDVVGEVSEVLAAPQLA